MPALGTLLSTAEISAKAIRTGAVTVTALETTKAVTFGTEMPSANYRVFFNVEGNLATVLWPTAKATTGFTLNLSVGVAGSISWMAVED